MTKKIKTKDHNEALLYQLEQIQKAIVNLYKPLNKLDSIVVSNNDTSRVYKHLNNEIDLLKEKLSNEKIWTYSFATLVLILCILLFSGWI